MPFDLAKFEEVFGYDSDKYSLDHMMREFQEDTEASTDEFAVFQAIIATGEFNSNYIFLDEKTLQNIARASNRDTAGDDIPIFPNHNRYDFQIGTMLTGKYLKSKKRVEGTFNIIRDDETNILINRMNNRVVRDVSPTVMGPIECDLCGDGSKMYRYGGCKEGHYLGDMLKIDGKDRLVTGTFKDAKLIEVSVVAKGAFSNTVVFSENKDLIEQALAEGIIDEKALDMIEYSFSVDLGIKRSKPEPLPPEPEPQPEPNEKTGGPPMSKPTLSFDIEELKKNPTQEGVTLLYQQLEDAHSKNTKQGAQIAAFEEEKKSLVPAADLEKVRNELTEAKQSIIEKDAQLGKITDYDASVAYTQKRAIEFYAKIRGVDVDNTSDDLFVSRKKALQESQSLSYLLSALEQYQEDYYADTTEFGGLTTRERREHENQGTVQVAVNPNHFDI